MVQFVSRAFKAFPVLLLLSGLLVPVSAGAQSDPRREVLALVKKSMDAYSNLDLEGATTALEEALGFAPDLDKQTLARIYVSYGVLWIGGFADNDRGQHDFTVALCLNSTIMVDPFLSSPDIDVIYQAAQAQVNDSKCQALLSSIVVPGEEPGPSPVSAYAGPIEPNVPPCGNHTPPAQQKQKHELPLYLEIDPTMVGTIAYVVVKYVFDGGAQFKDLPMTNMGPGMGAQVTCDEGQIRVYDPSSINYYIEGYDADGNLVCGHASNKGPYLVGMVPEADFLPALPGQNPPKECTPCPPWDPTCGTFGKPVEGQPCDPATGCAVGLVCGAAGVCEPADGSKEPSGPSKFYVNIGVGSGFGVMSQKMEFNKINVDGGVNSIARVNATPSGAAWAGIPLRLAVGYYLIPKLSLEATMRFDVKMDTFTQPQSCWDATGGDEDRLATALCSDYPAGVAPNTEAEWKKSVALTKPLDEGGKAVEEEESLVGRGWLANLRVRYNFVEAGGLRISLFGGLGYGHIKYRVKGTEDNNNDGDKDPYFPTPGFLNVEIGPGLAYYFHDNVGIVVEVPIDVLFLDGWAINFDLFLGFSFGF